MIIFKIFREHIVAERTVHDILRMASIIFGHNHGARWQIPARRADRRVQISARISAQVQNELRISRLDEFSKCPRNKSGAFAVKVENVITKMPSGRAAVRTTGTLITSRVTLNSFGSVNPVRMMVSVTCVPFGPRILSIAFATSSPAVESPSIFKT
jgi:hypothetical protein